MAVVYRNHPGITVTDGYKPTNERTRDVFGPEIEVCSFCGEKHASAYWQGSDAQPIRCCRTCATDVVPALIADALVGESLDISNEHAKLQGFLEDRISRVFWRAVSIAIRRAAKVSE